MRFEDYDYVELLETIAPKLPAGTRGAIVMTYPVEPREYEVEFVDANGDTIEVRTVKESQLQRIERVSKP
ncbi:MAG TPA: DUF4926 domain-containing protein [Polyangiaceae bacterium]|nr:DUF4926 domain-containing protein [Polyangiaceae bacterium]